MMELGIHPSEKKVYFGQLLGMCDQITFPLGECWGRGDQADVLLPHRDPGGLPELWGLKEGWSRAMGLSEGRTGYGQGLVASSPAVIPTWGLGKMMEMRMEMENHICLLAIP